MDITRKTLRRLEARLKALDLRHSRLLRRARLNVTSDVRSLRAATEATRADSEKLTAVLVEKRVVTEDDLSRVRTIREARRG